MSTAKIFILCLIAITFSAFDTYCPSNCLDYLGTCHVQNYSDTGCIVCALSIYNQDPDPVTNACVLNNQTNILTIDLQTPISLTGFNSSSLVPFTCGSWSISGKYVEGDYLSKVYQTPTSHYMVVVRYNLLFMGSTWSNLDTMTVSVDENTTEFKYKCAYPTAICSTKDCPRIGDIKASHNASNATIVFTSNILNSSGASWGISNLIIALLTCNVKCNTCFGPTPHQCLSCSNNSYLLGNTCVKQCPVMAIPSLNLCVPSCPGGFYSVISTKTCSPCSLGCTVCTGPLQTNCILDIIEPSLWQQQRQFWIFLIILSCIIILIGLVFLVIKRRKDKLSESLKTPIMQQGKNFPTQLDLSNMQATQKQQVYINDQIVHHNSQSSSSNSNESDYGPKPIKIKRKWKGKQ